MSPTCKLVIALLALPALAEESVRQLYERARLLQERNGRLEEAIRIYGRVVDLAKNDRALAARAQLGQALLYLRLGRNGQAQQAFRKVVTDFTDQPDIVLEARARLGILGAANGAVSVRQVRTAADANQSGSPSPDGRYLSFTDWATGELSIRDLATGENRHITHNSGDPFSVYIPNSVFSQDSKRIAYVWGSDEGYQVRVVGLDGAAPRILARLADVRNIELTDWSPDGKYILAYIEYRSSPFQIALIGASDGSVRALKQADTWPGRMSFSRDGKFILRDGPGSPGSGSDVYLLSIDGSRDVALAPHPADDFAIGWSADGQHVLFGSNRTGPLSLWKLSVRNGQALGEPQLVREDAGKLEPMGVTRDGAFYYWLNTGLRDVYSAMIDSDGAAVMEAPQPISQRFLGSNGAPDWSPDGRYLLYQSNRPGAENVIVIRSVETGAERELRTTPSLAFETPRWNAAGDAILISGNLSGKEGIYRIDPQSGAVTLAVPRPAGSLFVPDWSRDGRTLFGRFNGFNGIQRMDVATGNIQSLYNPNDPPGPFASGDTGPSDPLLSPDGRTLLFQQRDRPRTDNLLVMPPEGGTPRVLVSGKWPQQSVEVGGYAWTPDSRRILFAQGGEIFVVAAEGGQPRPTGLRMNGIRYLRLHPDGRHIAFEGGERSGEVWVAENLF